MNEPHPRTLRARTYDLLEPSADDPPLERFFNVAIMALIVANVVAVCLETMPGLQTRYATEFAWFEAVSVGIFTVELALRVWACAEHPRYAGSWGRLRFLRHPLTVIDMLAVLPSYLAFFGIPLDLRMARVVRVMRIFVLLRLARYSQALRTLVSVLHNQKEELGVTFVVGAILLLLASSTMYHLEHQAQPEAFSSIPAAMWWGVITLATVGYGDVYPVTPLGRALGGLFAVIGVGLFALPAGIIASGFAEEIRRRDDADEADDRCPHCGKTPADPLEMEPGI